MISLLKSDLFRNFMGGFVLGIIGIFAFQIGDAPTASASAHSQIASSGQDAAL